MTMHDQLCSSQKSQLVCQPSVTHGQLSECPASPDNKNLPGAKDIHKALFAILNQQQLTCMPTVQYSDPGGASRIQLY